MALKRLEYPAMLVRGFEERQYAEEFCFSGRFRMGNVECYRVAEGARRDDSEGEGHFRYASTVSAVDFCVDCDDVSTAPGYVWVVRINHVERLAKQLEESFDTSPYRFWVEGCAIVYDKGEIVSVRPNSIEQVRQAYAQKPRRFRDDNEYRLVAIAKGTPSERFGGRYIDVDLGGRLPDVEFLGADV